MKRRRPRWSLPPHDAIMDDHQRVFLIRYENVKQGIELVPFPDPPPLPKRTRKRRGNA